MDCGCCRRSCVNHLLNAQREEHGFISTSGPRLHDNRWGGCHEYAAFDSAEGVFFCKLRVSTLITDTCLLSLLLSKCKSLRNLTKPVQAKSNVFDSVQAPLMKLMMYYLEQAAKLPNIILEF